MSEPHISIRDLTMAYGPSVIQRDLNFDINKGDIFVIMGGSGCGKSTLLKHMLGLLDPAKGDIFYNDQSFFQASMKQQDDMRQRWGITYQSGGLFSAMTLAGNVNLPLQCCDFGGDSGLNLIATLRQAFPDGIKPIFIAQNFGSYEFQKQSFREFPLKSSSTAACTAHITRTPEIFTVGSANAQDRIVAVSATLATSEKTL